MSVFKIKHIPSGLFFKGGNMYKNRKDHRKPVNSKSTEQALELCFNKKGLMWMTETYVTKALKRGYEPGLDQVLKECEIVKYELTD